MAKHANLTEIKDLKVGDVVSSQSVNGALLRKVVQIRHNPGSVRYAVDLEDNDYFVIDEGDHVYTITED